MVKMYAYILEAGADHMEGGWNVQLETRDFTPVREAWRL